MHRRTKAATPDQSPQAGSVKRLFFRHGPIFDESVCCAYSVALINLFELV